MTRKKHSYGKYNVNLWLHTLTQSKIYYIVPSSSKFNLKRHGKDINFQRLFLVFLGFWSQIPINTRKSYRKLMSFWCLLRLNFEDEGATSCLFFILKKEKMLFSREYKNKKGGTTSISIFSICTLNMLTHAISTICTLTFHLTKVKLSYFFLFQIADFFLKISSVSY